MKRPWVIIVNVYAASKKAGALWREAESELKRKGVDYICRMTGKDGNATEIARKASLEGYRNLVAVGGDGTVHDVLNGIMSYVESPAAVEAGVSASEFTMAVIPLGSGNDWIKSTKVPLNIRKAVSMIASGSVLKQDVVRVSLFDHNGELKNLSYMANVAGVGIDADVCRVVNVNKKLGYRGKILYVLALIQCLWRRKPISVKVLGDGKVFYEGNILSIALGIGKYSGGGMRQTADAVLDDGLLDITLIPYISLMTIASRAYRLFTGSFPKTKEVFAGQYKCIEVIPESIQPYVEVDGEVKGIAPVRFDVLDNQINVIGVK